MFKLIALIFLGLQIAGVLGDVPMTLDDLPPEIAYCLENYAVPTFRLKTIALKNCETLPDDDENDECKLNVSREFYNRTYNSQCFSSIDNLPYTQRKFATGYYQNEVLKDRYTEIPENMRNCLDSVKSLGQSSFQGAMHCESFIRADNSNEGIEGSDRTDNSYHECMHKLIEKVFEDPQASKCIGILRTLTDEQKFLSGLYFFSVIFNQ